MAEEQEAHPGSPPQKIEVQWSSQRLLRTVSRAVAAQCTRPKPPCKQLRLLRGQLTARSLRARAADGRRFVAFCVLQQRGGAELLAPVRLWSSVEHRCIDLLLI